MLDCKNTVLVVIDIQGNLAMAMHEREKLFDNLVKLITGIRVFDIPIILTEQNPEKLGPTIPQIFAVMPDNIKPIPKMSFSCCGEPEFLSKLENVARSEIVIAGIEAHICVYQTAVDLLARGFRVHIITDAVSSRTAHNRDLAIMKMQGFGAVLTSVEMVLFELLKTADSPFFRTVAKIVK